MSLLSMSNSRALALCAGLFVAAAVQAEGSPTNAQGVLASGGKAPPVTSNGTPPQAPGSQAPMGGRAFGEHVSRMAPEHAMDHGAAFGECVAMMAQGLECEHHDGEHE